MRRHVTWMGLCGMLLACAAGTTADEYVWKDGKWVPAAKPAEGTAAGELALIRQHVDAGRRKKALKAVERFLEAHPDDPAREEALMLAGQAELDAGRYFQAYERFEKQLDEFPNGRYFERALTREMEVAEAFLAGKKKIVLGFLRMPATSDGLEILTRVAEHAPGSVIAENALLRIGRHHYDKREYVESAEAYDNYLEMFPKSKRSPHAKLQAARATYASFKGIAYDETPLIEAEQRFRTFANHHPAEAKKARIADILQQIAETRAKKIYDTARFYQRTYRPKSAKFYYRQLLDQYPSSRWAEPARRALRGEPAEAKPAAKGKPEPAGTSPGKPAAGPKPPTTEKGGQEK